MALTFPLTLIDDFPGWSTAFDIPRRQELSTTAYGLIYSKDFGSPLWRAAYQSITLSPNRVDEWRARLNVLGESTETFYGYATSRCYPINDPHGTILGGSNIQLTVIAGNNKEINLGGFPPGYVLSVGDMISIDGRDLHRVVVGRTANGSGVMSNVEVRPHIWPDVITPQPVSVVKPHCVMMIVPGSINSTVDANGRGSIYFEAIEART